MKDSRRYVWIKPTCDSDTSLVSRNEHVRLVLPTSGARYVGVDGVHTVSDVTVHVITRIRGAPAQVQSIVDCYKSGVKTRFTQFGRN